MQKLKAGIKTQEIGLVLDFRFHRNVQFHRIRCVHKDGQDNLPSSSRRSMCTNTFGKAASCFLSFRSCAKQSAMLCVLLLVASPILILGCSVSSRLKSQSIQIEVLYSTVMAYVYETLVSECAGAVYVFGMGLLLSSQS